MAAHTLLVTRVLFKQDLRHVHSLRDQVKCKAGECWMFVNGAETMARIVDSQKAVHCYWAPKGNRIDAALLKEMVWALRLNLGFGRNVVGRVAKLRRAA